MLPRSPAFSTTSTWRDRIYERLKRSIVEGSIQYGDRLPSVRSLSTDSGVARGTVLAALHRLAGEGYVTASRSGTRVVYRHRANSPPEATTEAPSSTPDGALPSLDLQPGLPAFSAFPKKLWSRLVGSEARRTNQASMGYPHPSGEPALKRAIAAYVHVSRGVFCDPEQVVITNCFQGSIDFIRRLVFGRSGLAWVEDPGYRLTRRILEATGIRPIGVPVDAQGLNVDLGRRLAPEAKVAFLSPTHQFPLGVRLSEARRDLLLGWADAVSGWIVEDDYDGEYHYGAKQVPALKCYDTRDRVVYCGTFSKVLFPAIRLAYVVVPRALVERASVLANTFYPAPSPLIQEVTARFVNEGHFARHLAKMRRLYAIRREQLSAALSVNFPTTYRADSEPSGMHLLLNLATPDLPIVQGARRLGLAPLPLSSMFIQQPPSQGLVLGFANVGSATFAEEATERLASVVRSFT